MQTEVEVKFLSVDHDSVREKLTTLGARRAVPMRLMRRAIMDFPDRSLQVKQAGWVRVRDEGDKITLTYKETTENTAQGAQEIEITVSSFDKTIELFEAIGLRVESLQESRRETWTLGKTEVVLDEWPWLDPYIEIEGEGELAIKEVAHQLGFSWDSGVFGSTTVAYQRQYPGIKDTETIGMIPEIKFNEPLHSWLKERKQ